MTEIPATATRAKRGDLIVVKNHQTDHGGYDRYTIGVVTNITRDGRVTKWRPSWQGDGDVPIALDAQAGFEGSWIMPKAEINVTKALETARANPWRPGRLGKPYGTFDEVKAAMSPHRTDATGEQS